MGTGYVGTSVGKLKRGEHNNDARSGEAKKGQLSEAEADSQPPARTAVVGLTYATPPCRVGKRPCKQGPPPAPWSRDHTRVKSLTQPARHLLPWMCRCAAPEPPGQQLPDRGAVSVRSLGG